MQVLRYKVYMYEA